MDILALGLAKKGVDVAVSGWRDVRLDESTGEIIAITIHNEVFKWKYPIPKNGKDGMDGLPGKNGKDGLNGFNIFIAHAKHGAEDEGFFIESDLETFGREIQVGDKVLTWNGKLYCIEEIRDSRTRKLYYFHENPVYLKGADGVSISNVYTEEDEQGNLKLLIEYSDGRVGHAGYLPEGPMGKTGPQGIQGEQGPRGEKGEPGPQAIAATDFQGEYENDKTYNSGQYVIASDLNAYICNTDGTVGENPITSEKWNIFAIHGPEGPQGPQGEQGIPGPVIIDDTMSDSSNNAVSNRVIKSYVDNHTPKLASKTQAGVIKINDTYDVNINGNGDIYPSNLSAQQYNNKSSYSFISKGTLENVIADKFKNKSVLDNIKNNGVGDLYLTDDGSYKKASSKLPFTYLEQVDDYLYEIQFDNILENDDTIPAVFGGCSTFSIDHYVYRNFDYGYTENATFLVKTPHYKGLAIIDGLYNGDMYNWNMALVSQLPNRIVDGMNKFGVFVSTHLVYNDTNYQSYTGGDSIPMYQIPSLILQSCHTLEQVQDFISVCKNKLTIPEILKQQEYTAMYFIKVDGISYVLQPNTTGTEYELVSLEEMEVAKLTNFLTYVQDTVDKSDPQMQSRPNGIERYNEITAETHLADLRFTKCYEEPNRISEFYGIDETTKDSPESLMMSIYSDAHTLYQNRERDGLTWQTQHSVIYNLQDYNMVVYVQEDWHREYDEHDVEDGLNGLSAYEIACNHGFEGTEEEWLFSLQGKDGKGGTYEEDILPHKHAWRVKGDVEGRGKWVSIKEDIMLDKPIKQYDIIRFEIDPADTASGIQIVEEEVKDIVFNPTETFQTGGSRIEVIGDWVKDNDEVGSFGAYHTTLSGWFKNETTFFVDRIGTATTDEHEFRLNRVIGVKELAEQGFNVDKALSRTSENAVTNEAITKAIFDKDYLFATMVADDTILCSAIAEGRNPLSEWTRKVTNMDITSKAGFVKLKAGRIYTMKFQVLYGQASGSLSIRDEANNILSNRGFVCAPTSYSDVVAVGIYRPLVDTYVRPYMSKPAIVSGQTSNAKWFRQCSYFTVEQL